MNILEFLENTQMYGPPMSNTTSMLKNWVMIIQQ